MINAKVLKKILIIGVGNTLRGDDAVGAFVCDAIEQLQISNITILKTHQLRIELLDDMIAYDKILIVDAAVGINNVRIEKVTGDDAKIVLGHHMPVGIFKQLAVKLYNKDLNLFTCAIPAFDFEFGNNLTETTKHFAEKVIELILQWSKEM